VIRAVLDTNVVVSAILRPEGTPGRVLARLVEADAFELVLSPALLAEYRRALGYPHVRKRIRATDDEIDRRMTLLDIVSSPVEIPTALEVAVARDPDDDKVLATAVEGCADCIVTGDGDLLALGEHDGIRIITPQAFLAILNG
jgi:hypothetical protein